MQQKNISAFKIGTAYIGMVVGAGFASGQEIQNFFARFGYLGLFGLIISTILFIIVGYIIMDLGRKLKATSHLEIIEYSTSKYSRPIFDFVITFFLFGTFCAMLSGSGAMMQQLFGIPLIFGSILMALLSVITVLTGIKGVIDSISAVVPFLIVSVIFISIATLFKDSVFANVTTNTNIINNWFSASILYAAYNLIFAICLLAPLGGQVEDKKVLKKGAIIGGLGLGIGALFIFLALGCAKYALPEIPMLEFAQKISPFIAGCYAVVLLAEIYTTAVGNLFGFIARLREKFTKGHISITIIVALVSIIISLLGFSKLISFLYPIMGYCGVIMFILLFYRIIKKRKE